ncbi:MAG: SMC-Scp complex subunit ScpB [Candidatus Woesearchaeota archaeon]
MEDKKRVEAILFAIGNKIEDTEIAALMKTDITSVKALLEQLKQEYQQKDTSILVINEGNKWKLTLKEEYMPLAQKIVPHTELSRAVMGSLAVIAWKAPILQSDIIQMRGTKAYEHIAELIDLGFITKQKHGRSYLLNLSQQFHEYFDLKGKDAVRDKFKDFKELTEADLVLEELEKKGIEPYDEKLGDMEVFDEPEPKKEEPNQEHLGKLEIIDEPEPKEQPEKEHLAKLEIIDEPEKKPTTETEDETN